MNTSFNKFLFLINILFSTSSFAAWDCHMASPTKIRCIWVHDIPKKPAPFFKENSKTLDFSSCAQALQSPLLSSLDKQKIKSTCKNAVSKNVKEF